MTNNDDWDDTDSNIKPRICFQDNDADGFGNPQVYIRTCDIPEGYVENSDDCNDNDANILAMKNNYFDKDGDGFGDPKQALRLWFLIPGFSYNGTDCDDDDYDIKGGN